MQYLTWTEAKEAMRNHGDRVKHQYFCRDEWFQMQHGRIVDENGYNMDGWYRDEAWQNDGWFILELEEEDGSTEEFVWKEGEILLASTEHEMMKTKMPALDFVYLEELVAASFMAGNLWEAPVSRLENQNNPSARNHKLYKGKGHNKLKKGKKK